MEIKESEKTITGDNQARSASEFELDNSKISGLNPQASDDTLVIDRNLKGLDYQLARCCHPIYGDPIFGFVTINGGIKIHRQDCPNAPELRRRYGYRVVKASINIDSHDGLFSGNLVVMLEDTSRLEQLIKKLRTVKGVKQVDRI